MAAVRGLHPMADRADGELLARTHAADRSLSPRQRDVHESPSHLSRSTLNASSGKGAVGLFRPNLPKPYDVDGAGSNNGRNGL